MRAGVRGRRWRALAPFLTPAILARLLIPLSVVFGGAATARFSLTAFIQCMVYVQFLQMRYLSLRNPFPREVTHEYLVSIGARL